MTEDIRKKEFNIKTFLFGKINRKLIFWFLIVIFIALATGFYIIEQSQSALQKTIGESSVDTSQNTLDSIDRITQRRLERWQEFADVNGDLKKEIINSNLEFEVMSNKEDYIKIKDKEWIASSGITDFIANLINNNLSVMLRDRTNFYKNSTGYDIFPEVFITNKYGAIVASTGKTSDYNQADESWWQKAKENPYYVSDIGYDESSGKYSLEIAIKIENNGEFIGILKAVYSIDEIISIINNIRNSSIKQKSEFSLINKDGKILYSTHNFTIFQKAPAEIDNLILKGGYTLDEHMGEEKLLALSHSKGYLTYPGQGWFLIIEYSQKEIFAPIYKIRNNMIIFTILISFIVIFLVISISKRITKPIKELSEANKKLQNKDFKIRVYIKSGDEIEELGDSFNKTAEILENLDKERSQIDKAKTEFLSITSHELRSPMTPMKAQLQMILGDYFGKLNNKQIESLQIVLNNTERLDKIIVDFLEISRIEAARLKFNFVRSDLAKTVNLVVDEMKGFMPEKNIKIVNFVEKLPVIEVDSDRFSQVLRNLINNSIKFTPENGKIEISAKLQNKMILFSVKDNGIGIPEKDQRRLFEPFYQVDNMYQHKSGGTGLGLAISKGIVESQAGKIWFSSHQGKGTIFYFTVPLKPIKNIKPIRLLFSESARYNEDIKNLFKNYLGPLGDKEFEYLEKSKGISSQSLNEYIAFLIKQGIISKEIGEIFKKKISLLSNSGVKDEK